jgi:glyoxylase-like metal-dependent hydrolase (beta-lactamase superfamily II)
VTATVTKLGPLGPYSNNAYLIADDATKDAIIVDAPFESAKTVEAARGYNVRRIVVTHRHGDHWAELDVLKRDTGAPVYCHEADREPYKGKVDGSVQDGEELAVGGVSVRVIHTPGHTPGSICLLVDTGEGPALISGDTLFPGGPGRSDNPVALQEMIRSITSRLHVLDDRTHVYPGHGDNTTIGTSKAEYAVFASKQHPADLCGDVLWESP